jgi:hypothetical protein
MLAIIGIVVVFVTAVFLLSSALHAYFKFRGARLISCPETGKPAAVEVDARHAAFTAPIRANGLRLKDCSRWPERKDCGQDCLRQIESSPEDCLVRTILTKWYKGKNCGVCGKTFGEITWLDHKPALMGPGKPSLEWSEIIPENIPNILTTHTPVCWDCYIAETFRRQYPELVVDRSWRPRKSHLSS